MLFDLDGTLIDSAPDLAGAGNDMRMARGLSALPLDHFRSMVGAGARGMVGRALAVTPQHADFEALRAHGFDDEDIWDIGAISAFFGLSNRMANLTAMRPNDQFFLMGRVPREKK